MAALTKDTNVPMRAPLREIGLKVAASTTIYAGSIVSVNASGYAIPAEDSANTTVMGRAQQHVDNSSGSNGDKTVEILKATFLLSNAASNSVDQADVGQTVYIEDDNTVVKAAGATNNVAAGMCEEIDSSGGIWVAIV